MVLFAVTSLYLIIWFVTWLQYGRIKERVSISCRINIFFSSPSTHRDYAAHPAPCSKRAFSKHTGIRRRTLTSISVKINNFTFTFYDVGRDNSVGIATRYVLDGPGIESRWGARFSAPVQTGPGAHPASYTRGTGSFPEVKRPGRGVDHLPPYSAEVKERIELHLYSPSGPSCPVLGWTLPLAYILGRRVDACIPHYTVYRSSLTFGNGIISGNNQLNTQLLYFTIRLLWSSTCFEHYAHHQEAELYWCSIWYRHSQ